MKAVILNGSNNGDNNLDALHNIILDELQGIGWGVESFILRDINISHCLGCFGCWVQTPGVCVINDAGLDIARAVIQSDLTVFLTPLTFGGYSAELKKALDRTICLVSPFFTKINGEVHHKARYRKYPRLMGVGVLPKADEESEHIFKTLVGRNSLNFYAPAHAAGVIISSNPEDEIRMQIRELLSVAGVK